MKNKRTTPGTYQGFSLIELLIVITIIGIISAIAVPNLLMARRSANEASAIKSVTLIHSCEMTYRLAAGNGVFTDIATLTSNGCLDSTFGSGTVHKSGYEFQLDIFAPSPSVEARFDLRARPVIHALANVVASTGSRDFGTNEAGAKYETTDNTPVLFDPITRLPTGTAVPVDR